MEEKRELPVVSVNSKELQEMLGCGRMVARRIGEAAGAKVQVGQRVLWNVEKVREYLARVAE